MKSHINPSLLELVTEYAATISAGEVDVTRPLKNTTPIVVFCENFFLQFFQSFNVSITSIDSTSKQTAVEFELELKRDGGSSETLALITWFEDFCDLYPDVLAMGYGGSRAVFATFHTRNVVRLLDRAEAWARSETLTELEGAVKRAKKAYKAALPRLHG
jgi:hypothetical protein